MKAVDSFGMIKSGSYIADVLTSIIEEVGAMHVVQIVMDNAKNCRSAGRILKMRFPHIYPSGCNTHSLNLVRGLPYPFLVLNCVIKTKSFLYLV